MLEHYHCCFPSKLFVALGNLSYSWFLDNIWEGKAGSQKISQGKDKNCAKSCSFISVCRAATEIERRLGILKPMWSGLTGSVTWLQQKSVWWAMTFCAERFCLFKTVKPVQVWCLLDFSFAWFCNCSHLDVVRVLFMSEEEISSVVLALYWCFSLVRVTVVIYSGLAILGTWVCLACCFLKAPCELRHILSSGWPSTLLCCSSYPSSWQSLFACCPCSLPALDLFCLCCPECF